MSEYQDPTWLVERAWSQYRLPTLQAMIEVAIANLERLEPGVDVVSVEAALASHRTLADDVRRSRDPVAEALAACIAELRHASGMPEADAQRAAHCELVRHYIAEQPNTWGETFGAALDKYRRAASAALQASFAQAQPEPVALPRS